MSTRHLAFETGDSSHDDDEWQDNQNGRDSSADDEGGDSLIALLAHYQEQQHGYQSSIQTEAPSSVS